MQTMPSKKQQIARIIETREPVVEEVEKQQNSLRKTALAIRSLETLQAHIMASGETALIERVRDVSFANIQHEVQVQLAILEKLKVRLSRKTLNIGVIGRARQGKSRLLQSLSGLSANEIPDGDNETCTGVRSTILHHPDASSAEVVFYTEQEFLQDVLTPYYHKIGLGPTPMSVEQFATKPLPAFPQQYKGDASLVAMYNHLVTYRTHIHEYRPLLTTPSPQSIPLSDVRQYVAQDTLDGQRIYYNYLAVREVKVYCQFPFAEDVGQVALVDMPGLGDTGIGDEERLVKALGEDIDVTLFVRMPRQFGDHWTTADTELYKTAHSALKDLLPLDRWAFMILNNTKGGSHKGDNTKNCEALLASLASKFTVSPGSPAFVDHTIVDCSDSAEVDAKILGPVLDYLLNHIGNLDRQYTTACRDGLVRLKKDITAELEKAQAAFGTSTASIADFTVFQERFKSVWKNLTNGLEALVAEQKKKSFIQNPTFADYFNKRFEACKTDTGIPSVEEIIARRHMVGAYMNVYNDSLHEIRTRLTYHFINLDDALKLSMSEVKRDTAEVFLKQGLLATLTRLKGDEFFKEMSENIPADLRRLKYVFRTFAKYELSYRGFFQQRIRSKLDSLYPDRTTIRPALSANMDDTATATEVHNTLKKVHAETVNALQKELVTYLIEPSQAAFAVVEEFADQVIRAQDAKEEWSRYYRTVQVRVWTSDFERIMKWERIQKEWLGYIENAQHANTFASR